MPEGDRHFHLFVYGTLRRNQSAADLLAGCILLAQVAIEGTLYDLGDYPALLLYGTTPVKGEVWRCPVDLLPALDEYEQMDRGLFRRVGVMAGEYPCWTYVAGPTLARQLTPDRRVDGDGWPPPR